MSNASKFILPTTMIALPTLAGGAALLLDGFTFKIVLAVFGVLAWGIILAGMIISRKRPPSPDVQFEVDKVLASMGHRKEDQPARVQRAWMALFVLIGLVAWVAGRALLQ